MNLALSAEQSAIAATADSFLSKTMPAPVVRELSSRESGPMPDEGVWKAFAELGWLGLSVPESVGGAGLGLPEEALLMREIGRHVAPGPFLASMLAATMAARCSEQGLVETIVSGARRVGIKVGELVVDALEGDLVLVLGESVSVLCEARSSDLVQPTDPLSRLARVQLGDEVLELADSTILDRARVLVAAQQLGIVEAVRDSSAAYARTREQFGRPIGAFQAVKHRCADMAVAAYACIGQVFQASLYVEHAMPDAPFQAAAAYALTTRAARKSTEDNILNHGAMGFTWDHDAHLYLKRAFLLERVLGPMRSSYSAILGPAKYEFS